MSAAPATPIPRAPRGSSHEVAGIHPEPGIPRDHLYGHENIARMCARFVTHLFACPEYPPTATHTQAKLPHFIAYALHRTELDPCVTYAALILLQRLKSRFPTARGSSGHRLFTSAFMIASKVICDDTYSNKHWCIVAQNMFPLREVNQMEREMCNYLEWDLTVDAPTLSKFTELVTRDFSGDHASYPDYPLSVVSKRATRATACAASDISGERQHDHAAKAVREGDLKATSDGATAGKPSEHDSPANEEKGAHYIITNNIYYGSVNNVGNIEKATFHPDAIAPKDQPPILRRLQMDLSNDPPSTASPPSPPPNSFVTFSSALARARYSSESLQLSDEETSDIVLATWGSFSPEDQAKVVEEAGQADDLHLAMLASEKMPARGEVQKGRYWSFAGRMTDFWHQKWNEAQVAVKNHFRMLGKELLMLPADLLPTEGSVESIPKSEMRVPVVQRSACRNKSTGWRAFRNSKHSPGKVPHPPSVLERLFGRFGMKNAKETTDTMSISAALSA